MKYEQDKDHPLNLQHPGKNVAEVAKNLQVSPATLYRALKKLGYETSVFDRDVTVRRIVCSYLSFDGTKKTYLRIDELDRYIKYQKTIIEKQEQEIKALNKQITALMVNPRSFDY